MAPVRKASSERGTSLVEVVIALLILMILMIGVLQMFSAGWLSNMSSIARTELTYKAEQAAENLRYINYLAMKTPSLVLPSSATGLVYSGTPPRLQPTGTMPLHLVDPSSGEFDSSLTFWGPGGARVIEEAVPRYRIDIQIDPNPADPTGALGMPLLATITARANVTASRPSPYVAAGNRKVVQYVAEIPR